MAGIFDGMGEAKSRIDGNYVIPSHFLGRINRVKTGKNRKDEGFFVVEMTVIHDCEPDKYERGNYGHAVGEEVSHMMMSKHDSFLGNVKGFIGSTLDMPDEEIGEEEAMAVCAEDQPLAGTIIEVAARNTKTRAGNDFTVVNYKGEVPKEDMFAVWETMGDDGAERQARFFPNSPDAA
jgi:hypothetical protein